MLRLHKCLVYTVYSRDTRDRAIFFLLPTRSLVKAMVQRGEIKIRNRTGETFYVFEPEAGRPASVLYVLE